ncbi:hypothetical protein BSQ39_00060 [Loigolactobacillus backii]|uniref:restriction endonuclease subunit S n=1 Tax=Loigolactobacillus backii TaxID=375175 RepID=UPI000C1C9DCA|nr:restriction endonuclease subunit S [Loigolactobacillus backii]PIO86316.1 hypothetical protein BSQ39_00060 [Loigolactobacillus backii]
MKDNQAKYPQLRFKGFTDPWEKRKLGELNDVRDGTHDSPKYVVNGHPFVTSKNLSDQGLDLSDVSYISDEDFAAFNKRSKVDVGDILFGMIGTIGHPVLVESDSFAIKNVALIKGGGKISNCYLLQLLKSPVFDRYVKRENAGGTQKFLGLNLVRDFVLRVPNDDEQRKIGTFFAYLDNLIAVNQRKLAKLKELKQGYLQKLFPKNGSKFPQLRFAGFADAWEQRKASNIFQIITDYVANGSFAALRKNVSYSEKKDFAIVVRLTDYSNGYNGPFLYTSEAGYKFLKKSSLVPGDILISNVGANAGLVYRTPNINVPMTLGPNSILVRTQTEDTEFLYQMMHSINGVHKIKMQIGISAQPKFNKTEFRQIEFSLPGKREQEKIGIVLNYFDQLIASNQRKLEKLQELKKGYLQKMFC